MKPEFQKIDGMLVMSSTKIATMFDRIHRDILNSIKGLKCSPEFMKKNYIERSYRSRQNKMLPCYNITDNGFMFLCLGFKGDKAAEVNEWYISEKNKMELFIVKM